nr:hypothetical protein [Candidatus Cloacimonadota bacterium]
MSKKVIVLCGGFSEEKEVSKKSSSAISGALIDNGFNVELVDPVDSHLIVIWLTTSNIKIHISFLMDYME